MSERPDFLRSGKPYLIRAIWEWCTDHGLTPYLTAQLDEWSRVPREFARGGRITLNISQEATGGLDMGDEFINFKARFNGVSRDLSIPVSAVVGIVAHETGEGMHFDVTELEGVEDAVTTREPARVPERSLEPQSAHSPDDGAKTSQTAATPPGGSHLRRVK